MCIQFLSQLVFFCDSSTAEFTGIITWKHTRHHWEETDPMGKIGQDPGGKVVKKIHGAQ